MRFRVNCYFTTTLIDPVDIEANSREEAEQKAREMFYERNARWEEKGGTPRTLVGVEVK